MCAPMCLKHPIITFFATFPIGTATFCHADGCKRLRTVANGCKRLRTVANGCKPLRTVANIETASSEHTSIPRPPKSETRTLRYAFGGDPITYTADVEQPRKVWGCGFNPSEESLLVGKGKVFVTWEFLLMILPNTVYETKCHTCHAKWSYATLETSKKHAFCNFSHRHGNFLPRRSPTVTQPHVTSLQNVSLCLIWHSGTAPTSYASARPATTRAA